MLEPYIDRYFATAEDISASRGVWATKGTTLRKSVLRNLFPWPADLRGFLDPARPVAGRGRPEQLDPAGHPGAP